MEVKLFKANIGNAKDIYAMQVEAFEELLKKYQDFDTSPANESVEKVEARLKQDFTFYYFICIEQQRVETICVVNQKKVEKQENFPNICIAEISRKGYCTGSNSSM